MFSVDGGYVSFKLAFGNFDLWEMKWGKDISIFAMDSKPKRREIYPEYKAQRIYGQTEAIQLVSDLRKHIIENSKLPVCKIEGSEADDIIACWYLFDDKEIVTQDKDYFQLPNLERTLTHEFMVYPKQSVLDKTSNFTRELAKRNFALYQMLHGCTADNVSRILAYGKEGKSQVQDLLKVLDTPNLQTALLSMFEEKIILNAQLILFPYFDFMNNDVKNNWFELWCNGDYYNQNHWTEYYQIIQNSKRENRVFDSFVQMELFGLV